MIRMVPIDTLRLVLVLSTSPVGWNLYLYLLPSLFSRADQLSQAWKEGNYTVAEFMSQKIMSMYLRKACGLLTDSRGRHI